MSCSLGCSLHFFIGLLHFNILMYFEEALLGEAKKERMGVHGQGIQCDRVQLSILDYQRRRGFLITHEGVVGAG